MIHFSLLKKKPVEEVSAGYKPKPNFNKGGIVLVFALLLVGASFYEGTVFQHNSDINNSSVGSNTAVGTSSGQGADIFTQNGGMRTGSFVRTHVFGQVTAVSSSSISVQDAQTGATTTLSIASSTQISVNGQSGSASDIQVGDPVLITKTSATSTQASKIVDTQGTTYEYEFNSGSQPTENSNPEDVQGLSSN